MAKRQMCKWDDFGIGALTGKGNNMCVIVRRDTVKGFYWQLNCKRGNAYLAKSSRPKELYAHNDELDRMKDLGCKFLKKKK